MTASNAEPIIKSAFKYYFFISLGINQMKILSISKISQSWLYDKGPQNQTDKQKTINEIYFPCCS